jgi:DNA-binding helix-hairpin-helix protein with protein kinase domain
MENIFKYKSINAKQKQEIESCKESASALFSTIEDNCPSCKESELAIIKLEECVMWLSKAISHN